MTDAEVAQSAEATAAAEAPLELTEAALEALLFVAERPLSRREIANLAGVPRETVDARLGDLEVSLRERGIRLITAGERIALATSPEAGALIARYVGVDAVRLSPASLETLAIVAYRQPVTRAAVERIRGVDTDYTLRSLLHRRLVTELGRSDAPGRPILYGTGFEFLERFGLTTLDELPPLDVDVATRLAEEGRDSEAAAAAEAGDAADPPPPPRTPPPPPRTPPPPRNRSPTRRPEPRSVAEMPTERIQKVLANAGVASRRASDALVAAGRVRIDGRTASIGERVDPLTSIIEVDGIEVGIGVVRAYIALHKPAGVTSTTQDRHADTTVLDLVPTSLMPDGTRLYPVGRLDQDSEGLLLLTNDGDWAERILHPRFGVTREYAVALDRPLDAEQIRALAAGVRLEEGRARLAEPLRPLSGAEIAALGRALRPGFDAELTWYRASLRQGWKRQLRRMFGAVGAPIVRLARVSIGTVRLGDLRSGRSRRLTPREITALTNPAVDQKRASD